VPALAEALKEEDPVSRESAIVALGEIGPEAARTAKTLGELLLKEKGREIRIRIATTLGKIGTAAKVAVPDMIQAFADQDLDKVLTTLVQAQNSQMRNVPGGQPPGGMQPGGQPPMQPGGQPPAENDPAKRGDLQTALNLTLGRVDKLFQEKNAEALSKIGRGAVPALRNGLKGNSTLVRWGCIKAVGMIGPAAKDAANELFFWGQYEPIPQIKEDARTAFQKVTAKR
jgi:HEAT repeat protein